MGSYCNKCRNPIAKEVDNYSKKYFFKPLCMSCQPTENSRKLGWALIDLGWKIEFESGDGWKSVDIKIKDENVIIEVDGAQHNLDKKQALTDLKRTFYSWSKNNCVTIRIPNTLTKDEKTLRETAKYLDEFLKNCQEEDDNFWNFL